jgi:hypothetical protein
MIEALIISLCLFIAYLVAITMVSFDINKELIPPSISENFYLFEKRKKGLGWMFYGWCALIGVSVMAMMFELSTDKWYQFIPLFAGSGLVLVGVAPRFKNEDRKLHYAGAAVCAVSAALWIILAGCWYVIAGGLIAASIISLCDRKNMVFWYETAIFISMYIALTILI